MAQSVNVYGTQGTPEDAERLREFFNLKRITFWDQFNPTALQPDTLYLSQTRIPGMLAYPMSTMLKKLEAVQ